jgi:MFS family permease
MVAVERPHDREVASRIRRQHRQRPVRLRSSRRGDPSAKPREPDARRLRTVLAVMRTPGPVRRFLLASLQSSVGNAIGYVALLLLAYDRFHSPWAVSLVLLADFLPAIVMAPVFGALADRSSRRLLVVGGELLCGAAFVGLAFADSFAVVLALALVAGMGTALYHPASKASLAGLAGDRAEAAMGALVTVWSAASVAGPALGAALLLAVSPSVLLALDAATFFVSAVVLSRLALDREETVAGTHATSDNVNLAIAAGELVTAHDGDAAVGHGVRAGLRAARAVGGLGAVVGAGAAATLAFSLMNVAEPLLATDELHAGGAGFALLVCAYGIGSTIGALRGRADARFLLASLAAGGLSLCASAIAVTLWVAAATFLATGLFAGAVMSSDHQLVTRMAPAAIRGRVFGLKDSLDSLAFCTAFAGGGVLATVGGSRSVFAVSGAGALIVATLAAFVLRQARASTAAAG